MKQSGAASLSRHLTEDRFHVAQIRGRDEGRALPANDDFIQDFANVNANDEAFLDDFQRYDSARTVPNATRGNELDQAFELYLSHGVSQEVFAPQAPQHVLMDQALSHVQAAYPGMPQPQMLDKATEMLHNLNLAHRDEWSEEFRSMEPSRAMLASQRGHHPMQHQYPNQLMPHHQRRFDRSGPMRMQEPQSFRPAPAVPTMMRLEQEQPYAGLDRAYEAEKWVEEFREESQKREEEEDDGWFDNFLQKERTLQEDSLKQISAKLNAIDDPKLQNSNFMSFVRGFAANKGAHPDNWSAEQEQIQAMDRQVASQWTEEFGMPPIHTDEELDDFLASSRRADDYQFAPNNPFLNHADPYALGCECFEQGRFADAVLALEAAISQNQNDGRAWHMLGKAHQEGDKDYQAIAALQRATECDPNNLLGLVDQAVSYTNNMQKDRCMASLEQWLRNNPRYSQFAPTALESNSLDVGAQLRAMYERQDVLIDCFVEAAQTSPENVDPDVQICLGLLYSLSLEYDNAAQCFDAALSKRDEDYALWNKLGATLANGGRSQEALQAYFQALERKPLYVRARANLGISFLSMKMYLDAAKQFLSALSIEPDAIHIWNNLETAFSYLDRPDLIELARARNVKQFKKEFDF